MGRPAHRITAQGNIAPGGQPPQVHRKHDDQPHACPESRNGQTGLGERRCDEPADMSSLQGREGTKRDRDDQGEEHPENHQPHGDTKPRQDLPQYVAPPHEGGTEIAHYDSLEPFEIAEQQRTAQSVTFLEGSHFSRARLGTQHHVGDAPGKRVGDQEDQERSHQQTHHQADQPPAKIPEQHLSGWWLRGSCRTTVPWRSSLSPRSRSW